MTLTQGTQAARALLDEGHDRKPAYADFLLFLSSSTSVNSASTTSSFLPSAPVALSGSPPGAPASPPPPCCALYIASPSFIEACASVLVFDLMASASSPLSASLRSAIAFSIAE